MPEAPEVATPEVTAETTATTEVVADSTSAEGATPESTASGPKTTEDHARLAMESLEKEETSEEKVVEGEGVGEAVEAQEAAPTKPKTVEKAEELSEADKLLKEAGYDAKVSGRDNRIPYSKVRTIIDNQLAKGRQEFETERTELSTKIQNYETTLNDVGKVEQLMLSKDPRAVRAFLEGLAAENPTVRQVIGDITGVPAGGGTSSEGVQDPGDMPEPNLRLPDGSMTWDMDGIKALLDWNSARVEQKLAPRLQTVDDLKRQREQEVEEAENSRLRSQYIAEAESRMAKKWTTARETWESFSDHEKEIIDFLKKDMAEAKRTRTQPKHDIDSAYRAIVVPKLIANRNAIREEILNEVKGRPTSTSTPTVVAPARVSKDAGKRTTEDIAREVIQQSVGS